jgi:hypothetical protein
MVSSALAPSPTSTTPPSSAAPMSSPHSWLFPYPPVPPRVWGHGSAGLRGTHKAATEVTLSPVIPLSLLLTEAQRPSSKSSWPPPDLARRILDSGSYGFAPPPPMTAPLPQLQIRCAGGGGPYTVTPHPKLCIRYGRWPHKWRSRIRASSG